MRTKNADKFPTTGSEKTASRLLVLGAAYGTGNMGVDALLSGTIRSALLAEPDCQIDLLDYGHASERFSHLGPDGKKRTITLINLRFSWRLHLPNNGFRLLGLALLLKMLPAGIRRRWIKGNDWLREIASANYAVALAGGDSFSDIYGMRRLLYVCLPQFLVSALGVKSIMLPQTVGPFKSRAAQKMGSLALNLCHQVYARDRISHDLASELVSSARSRPKLSQDMAFALLPLEPDGGFPECHSFADSTRPLVGMNVSGLLYAGGYTGENMFGLQAGYPEMLNRLVNQLVEGLGCNVLLVSHVTGAGENDVEACLKLAESLIDHKAAKRLMVASGDYNHQEVKGLIGKCEFFLGSRMHACIAALSQGIPAVGLAYSRKFAGVYETIEADELVLDLRSLDTSDLMNKVTDLFSRRADLSEQITEPVRKAQTAAESLLTAFLGGGSSVPAAQMYRQQTSEVTSISA